MLGPARPALWIFAAVLTAAYLLLLFGGHHQARLRLIEVNEYKIRHDVNRTARALQLYFAERAKDLMTLRRLSDIEAFYANRALGMSLEYGLMASLLQVQNRLRKTRDNLSLAGLKKTPNNRLFSYFALVDNERAILADSEGALPTNKIPDAWIPLVASAAPNSPVWHSTDDAELLISVPVFFKDTKVGSLIAELALAPIYRQVLSGLEPDPDRFDFLTRADGAFLLGEQRTEAQRQALAEHARLKANQVRRDGAQHQDNVLVEVALPISRLTLTSVVDFSHVRKSATSTLPLTIASTLPVALFAVMVALSKSERARREAEKVSAENLDLERLVQARTKDLEIAAHEAQRANQAKSEFLANMSHELRTPMHAILSFARLGLKRSTGTEQAKLNDYFNKICDSGERLLTLLNDLLDISKLEAGRMTCDFKQTDFITLVDDARRELEPLMAQRGLTLQLALPASLSIVLDDLRIGQVIRNLLANAAKFTAENSHIKLQARRLTGNHRQMLELRVADEGPGIPETELDAIFDKFIQSSRTTTQPGGTGLGLAICKEIIARHRGRIWAENCAEGGACFIVQLPVDGPEAHVVDADRLVRIPRAESDKRTASTVLSHPNGRVANQGP